MGVHKKQNSVFQKYFFIYISMGVTRKKFLEEISDIIKKLY